jgi:hypothetical protein
MWEGRNITANARLTDIESGVLICGGEKMEKKFRRIQELLNEIRQDLKKEGGVRAEMALTRLTSVEERLDNIWSILTRKF